MKSKAVDLNFAELAKLGPQAAEDAVLRDLESGITVEGGARFVHGDESAIVLARLSPDRRLRTVRAVKTGASSNG